MSIDWSKAPEGTTGAMVAHFNGKNTRWGDVEFIPSDEPDRFVYDERPDAWVYHEAPHVFPEPATEWTGEGLPPVGTVCEVVLEPGYRYGVLNDWKTGDKVECIAHHEMQGDGHISPVFFNKSALSFSALRLDCYRPILSAEQIAAEERAAAIEEMWATYWKPEPQTAKEALGLLWDAGWRKQVQP